MARIVGRFCSRILFSGQLSHQSVVVLPTRTSVWPTNYIEPVYKKEVQEKLKETDEMQELAFCPVKAVGNDLSSSAFSDPSLIALERIIMRKGRKDLARDLLNKTLWEVKKMQVEKYRAAPDEEKDQIELDAAVIVKKAIENCKPVLITKSIKRGGATYQVPYPVTNSYSNFLAMNWLVTCIKDRPKPRKEYFAPCLARELVAAFNNEGKVIKKKHDLHKLCEANKAYAHYRWG